MNSIFMRLFVTLTFVVVVVASLGASWNQPVASAEEPSISSSGHWLTVSVIPTDIPSVGKPSPPSATTVPTVTPTTTTVTPTLPTQPTPPVPVVQYVAPPTTTTTTTVAAPPETATAPSTDLAAAWQQTAICEEGGRNDPTYGYYGIIPSSWQAMGGGQFSATAGGASQQQQLVIATRIQSYPPDVGGCQGGW